MGGVALVQINPYMLVPDQFDWNAFPSVYKEESVREKEFTIIQISFKFLFGY